MPSRESAACRPEHRAPNARPITRVPEPLRATSPNAGCASCGRRQNRAVQFSPDLRDRVADGTITVSYRLWSRPKVKVGGVYRSGSVAIEIDDIELLPFSSITDEDLARTGENDVEALRRRAAHAGPIGHDTLLYRVEFHVARQPDDDDR
jgi:hypothetical protein